MIFEYKDNKKDLLKLLQEIENRDGQIITLSIGRLQGFQNGHKRLFDLAEEIGHKNIFGLGSCQISEATFSNPFSTQDRVEMIRKVKGYDKRNSGKLSILKLFDIGAINLREWKDHVLSQVDKFNLPKPNVYIAGSKTDILDNGFENDPNILCISLDRLNSGIMSGTDVRKSIINGNEEWKEHVPFVLHSFLEKKFPKELTLKELIKRN